MTQTHIILTGDRGAGKSTLIRRLLLTNERPVCGFVTERLAADASGFHPIYIHPAGAAERRYTGENRVGICDSKQHSASVETFDALGAAYIRQARPGDVIVMDELGFMESRAEGFKRAVFAALDGDIPVIAAVKSRLDVPFLNDVRAHPNVRVYTIDPSCRETLCRALLPVVTAWNAGAGKA